MNKDERVRRSFNGVIQELDAAIADAESRGPCDYERLRDLCGELTRAHYNELSAALDPQRIRGRHSPGSFGYAIEQMYEFRWQHATNDTDAIPYINAVKSAHEKACMTEYHRGWTDGRAARTAAERSLDKEREAACRRLRDVTMPEDADSYGNLSAICGAIFHAKYGWTRGACDALRERLAHLLVGDRADVQPDEATEFADRLRECAERGEDVTLFGVDYTPCERANDEAGRLADCVFDIADHLGVEVGDHDGPADAYAKVVESLRDYNPLDDTAEAVAEYHRQVRRWMGEAKNLADALRHRVDARPASVVPDGHTELPKVSNGHVHMGDTIEWDSPSGTCVLGPIDRICLQAYATSVFSMSSPNGRYITGDERVVRHNEKDGEQA